MPSPAERPKIKARDVVEGEVRAEPNQLLSASNTARAIEPLARELLASFRTTNHGTLSHIAAATPQHPDPTIEGLDLSYRAEEGSLRILRDWIRTILDTVQRERNELAGTNGALDEDAIPFDLNLPRGSLKGTVTKVTQHGMTVATDGRSYYVQRNGAPMGPIRPGETQIWIEPTDNHDGPKPDACFICRVGEEPRRPQGANPSGNGAARRGGHSADARRESRV